MASPAHDAAALGALAAGLCQDAGVGVEVAEAWGWEPQRRVIRVAQASLERDGPDVCAGIVAREVGHHALTRFSLFPLSFPSLAAAEALQVALDRPRVSRWMAERYPGTRAWFAAAAEATPQPKPGTPAFLQFCIAAALEPLIVDKIITGPLQLALAPSVIDALSETRAARLYVARCVPPVDGSVENPEALEDHYWHEVLPDRIDVRWLPSPAEQQVQAVAHAVWQVVRDRIAPVAERLLQADLAAVEAWLACQDGGVDRARRVRDGDGVRDLVAEALGARLPPSAATDAVVGRAARDVLDGVVRRDAPRTLGADRTPPRTSPDDIADFADLPDLPPLEAEWRPPDNYEAALERVRDQIEALTKHLEDVLRPRVRMHQRRGYASGRRVDLRGVMAYEADPRRYDRLWVRNTIPERRNVAASLLVDLSGSMQGQKAAAAVLGTIVMAETLQRLEIPFAVNGFQDVVIPLLDFGQPLSPEARRHIAAMVQEVDGCRPGGNNQPAYNDDGPCLLAAAEQLLAHAGGHRLLVVVSDGLPEGRRSNKADLHAAVAHLAHEDLELLALGLGPHTEHVLKFYPQAVANVGADRFAEEIGALVERIVLT